MQNIEQIKKRSLVKFQSQNDFTVKFKGPSSALNMKSQASFKTNNTAANRIRDRRSMREKMS